MFPLCRQHAGPRELHASTEGPPWIPDGPAALVVQIDLPHDDVVDARDCLHFQPVNSHCCGREVFSSCGCIPVPCCKCKYLRHGMLHA